MSLLSQKKSKMEQEETETNLQILLDFMHCLKKKKLDELNEVLALDSCYLWISLFIFLASYWKLLLQYVTFYNLYAN